MTNHKMLEKALFILEMASQYQDGISLSMVCAELNMPKSSAFNLLNTFANMGYLNKNPDSGRFTIGLKVFELGSSFIQNNDNYAYVYDVLRKLVQEVGETAHMAVLDGRDIVYINKYDCSHSVRMISNIGKRVPAHATALGKALLTALSDEEIKALYKNSKLATLTPNTISTVDELLQNLADIRAAGFATECEESTPGVQCIAIPVFSPRSNFKTGISISVPLSRSEDGLDKYKEPLTEAKKQLIAIL